MIIKKQIKERKGIRIETLLSEDLHEMNAAFLERAMSKSSSTRGALQLRSLPRKGSRWAVLEKLLS